MVFPELALDHATFARIRDHIRSHMLTVDMLVAGVSTNEWGRVGNFVAVASFRAEKDANGLRQYRQTVREKHHRWQLERSQLRAYGLLGVLSPELAWWEKIQLGSRKVDFTVLRRDSVFAAMICEDLARVDPCQQVIRAVGPNLVFALLMDAPQLAGRWPARYATVLTEDPACAVLTLTSRGLMTRQHRTGTYRSRGDDRVIAMWRDDRNASPIELKCPYDAQAVLLTVVEETAEDISLDGRCDTGAKAWRYVGDAPVRIEGEGLLPGHPWNRGPCVLVRDTHLAPVGLPALLDRPSVSSMPSASTSPTRPARATVATKWMPGGTVRPVQHSATSNAVGKSPWRP